MRYTPVFETQVQVWVEAQIDHHRLAHVQGVVDTVTTLAERHAPDQIARVRLAGWLHDVAKNWGDDALLAYAQTHRLPVTEIEHAVPMLLHGAVGYALAAEHFGLDDPLLQSACAHHISGAPNMNAGDKIVFLADLIEPTRSFRKLETLRQAAKQDLDTAVLLALDIVLKHLIRSHRVIDPKGIALRNELIRAGVCYRT